jgi:hypothetical protein
LIYQRTETARLTLLNLKTGEVDGELSKMEVFGGEVSGIGILAAFAAHGPGDTNNLCTMDVNARLAAPLDPQASLQSRGSHAPHFP